MEDTPRAGRSGQNKQSPVPINQDAANSVQIRDCDIRCSVGLNPKDDAGSSIGDKHKTGCGNTQVSGFHHIDGKPLDHGAGTHMNGRMVVISDVAQALRRSSRRQFVGRHFRKHAGDQSGNSQDSAG